MDIVLPNEWTPRPYQRPLWDYLEGGGRRAVAVWHRRAGKESVALNRTAIAMIERVGTYWHMLPQQAQARKVVWDSIDRAGRKMIDQAFPKELRESAHSQEMKITFKNGSIWQLCGSDNYDSLVGSNPVGVTFSEYSVAKPSAWDYIRPILAENDGWALFIYTPRGKNHGHILYEMAEANPGWFCELLTVNETQAISRDAIQAEREAGMDEDMIKQEFYCSFTAAIVGAYYGQLLEQAEADGRIRSVPYDPSVPVHTSWDIGVDDETAIWFWQAVRGGELHVIDYLEGNNVGVEHYLGELTKKPYIYGTDYVPHDFEARSFAAGGRSAADIARGHGRKLHVGQRMNPLDRVQAGRIILPRCWFDEKRCAKGLDALRSYRKEYDEKNHTYKSSPAHDWASHPADAFGEFSVSFRDVLTPIKERERYRSEFPGRQAGNSWMNS